MHLACPNCETTQAVDGALARDLGAKVRCASCNTLFEVDEQVHSSAAWWIKRAGQEVAESVPDATDVVARVADGSLGANDLVSKDGERWTQVALWMSARDALAPPPLPEAKRSRRWLPWAIVAAVIGVSAFTLSRDVDHGEDAKTALAQKQADRVALARKLAEPLTLQAQESAIEVLLPAIEADPTDAPVAKAAAIAHIRWVELAGLGTEESADRERTSHLEKARSLAETAVRRAPFDASMHLVLARTLLEYGEHDAARRHLEESKRLGSVDSAWVEAKMLRRNAAPEEAERMLSPFRASGADAALRAVVLLDVSKTLHGADHARTRHPAAVQQLEGHAFGRAWMATHLGTNDVKPNRRRASPGTQTPGPRNNKPTRTKETPRRKRPTATRSQRAPSPQPVPAVSAPVKPAPPATTPKPVFDPRAN